MKIKQEVITVREGEWFNFDPNYNWYQHDAYPNNPETVGKKIKMFEEIYRLYNDGKQIKIKYDPMLEGKLLKIGMWDGWPYWKPVPHYLIEHWYGSEKHVWYDIHSYEII